MDSTVTMALMVGFFVVPVISVVNKEKWTSQTKGVVAFVICLLAAGATAWYEQSLDVHDVRKTMPIVLGTAIASYHQFWKPTGIAPAIESKTS